MAGPEAHAIAMGRARRVVMGSHQNMEHGVCRRMPTNQERTMSGSELPQHDVASALPGGISQNIETIVAFHEKEEQEVGSARRLLARISAFISRPGYLAGAVALMSGWVLCNALATSLGLNPD